MVTDSGRLGITVRPEQPGDESAVRGVELAAFGRSNEADVVDLLRASSPQGVSLVAVVDGRIAGHILFEPAVIESASGDLPCVGLGPLAVLPAYQRQGVGSVLVRAGLEAMRAAGHPCVVIVGHPWYYPRFGFRRGAEYGVRFDPDVGDACMLYPFDEAAVRAHPGVARERPEFAAC